MQRLECLVDGCSATIEAETEQEVMAQSEEHAKSSHPEVELDDETVEKNQIKYYTGLRVGTVPIGASASCIGRSDQLALTAHLCEIRSPHQAAV